MATTTTRMLIIGLAATVVACSVPALVGKDAFAERVPDHPNRCYRLYEAGMFRDACLKQFPTGDAYTFEPDGSHES